MKYTEFKEAIVQKLREEFPTSTRISIECIRKNNGTSYDAVLIHQPSMILEPTINLSSYYMKYLEGMDVDTILRQIIDEYNAKKKPEFDSKIFTDTDTVKTKVIYKLIHYERNRELLTDIPHIRYLDLAITFHYLVDKMDNAMATAQFTNEYIKFLGLSVEELYAYACRNTPILLGSCSMDLQEFLKAHCQMLGNEQESDELIADDVKLYSSTNKYGVGGASTILYPDVLKGFSNHFNSDLFVLPSSIHEVLVTPAEHGYSKEMKDHYNEIVREVNESHVSADEILSDHAYFYDRKKDELCVA